MKNAPRISLARLPTPIQKLNSTSLELGKEIYIWRDDLNGMIESGNKLRKLEFLMADAISKGCDWIITCGGPQSNHTRATAVVARQLGLGVTILTLPKPGYDRSKTANANLLLNLIFDSKMVWLDYEEFQKKGASYDSFLHQEAQELKSHGKKPYIIPLGGSNHIGSLGYSYAVEEMLVSWRKVVNSSEPENLFCALGSSGTYVGLQLGIQQQHLRTHLYGINVIGPIETAKKYALSLTESIQQHYSISINQKQSTLVDGYVGEGYSIASDDDLSFYVQLARKEGILLDPCYTGKAFQGMISEIKKNPTHFGKQILFLHSGGTFGNFAYHEQFDRILTTR